MAKKRGFFAELERQNQIAARQRQQQATAAQRAHLAAQRRAEAALRQAEQASIRAQRANAAEQKAAEKEAQRLHLEARQAEVDSLNAELTGIYEEIDSLLASTLSVDDYVDLETLRQTVEHPPFESEHERPLLPPPMPTAPLEPVYQAPPGEPSKLGGMFGARKKWDELEERARQAHDAAHSAWRSEVEQLPNVHEQIRAAHNAAEQRRLADLEAARAEYDSECSRREQDITAANQRLDELIQGLAYGVDAAIQEYVSIVLGNSVYPDTFLVEHEYEFNSSLRELTLTALVPPPDRLPKVREYKYVRAKDEIVETALPQREVKDRYRNALAQVAVRTLHEIFEADRSARVGTIALTVATENIDSGTGLMARTPLVAVAAERDHFMSFDLANVVPQATLETLGAQISKSPADLTPIDMSKGIRGR